jgi:hypothetical protein
MVGSPSAPRGARDGSTHPYPRHPGMLLLDPKASGALLRRRLRIGDRRSGQAGHIVRDVRVAVALSAGEGGISSLCGAVSRRMVRVRGSRAVRQASRSAWEARAAASGLGGELSAELQGSCSGGAEIARIEGRPLDAMDLYERAIAAARANGFAQNEALVYELAARFYAARGFEEVAHL